MMQPAPASEENGPEEAPPAETQKASGRPGRKPARKAN